MNADEWSLGVGMACAAVIGIQYIRRCFTQYKDVLAEPPEEAVFGVDPARLPEGGRVSLFRPGEVPDGVEMRTTTPRGVIIESVALSRDTYGRVVDEAPPARRYKPTCEWCRGKLVLDRAGKCSGCGAAP